MFESPGRTTSGAEAALLLARRRRRRSGRGTPAPAACRTSSRARTPTSNSSVTPRPAPIVTGASTPARSARQRRRDLRARARRGAEVAQRERERPRALGPEHRRRSADAQLQIAVRERHPHAGHVVAELRVVAARSASARAGRRASAPPRSRCRRVREIDCARADHARVAVPRPTSRTAPAATRRPAQRRVPLLVTRTVSEPGWAPRSTSSTGLSDRQLEVAALLVVDQHPRHADAVVVRAAEVRAEVVQRAGGGDRAARRARDALGRALAVDRGSPARPSAARRAGRSSSLKAANDHSGPVVGRGRAADHDRVRDARDGGEAQRRRVSTGWVAREDRAADVEAPRLQRRAVAAARATRRRRRPWSPCRSPTACRRTRPAPCGTTPDAPANSTSRRRAPPSAKSCRTARSPAEVVDADRRRPARTPPRQATPTPRSSQRRRRDRAPAPGDRRAVGVAHGEERVLRVARRRRAGDRDAPARRRPRTRVGASSAPPASKVTMPQSGSGVPVGAAGRPARRRGPACRRAHVGRRQHPQRVVGQHREGDAVVVVAGRDRQRQRAVAGERRVERPVGAARDDRDVGVARERLGAADRVRAPERRIGRRAARRRPPPARRGS